MLGENGTGKTTFIRMLAGSKGFESDNGEQVPSLNVSQEFGKIEFQTFFRFHTSRKPSSQSSKGLLDNCSILKFNALMFILRYGYKSGKNACILCIF